MLRAQWINIHEYEFEKNLERIEMNLEIMRTNIQ